MRSLAFVAAASGALFFVSVANANTAAQLWECSDISANKKRLACYDEVMSAFKTDQSSASSCEVEDWKYSNTRIGAIKVNGRATCSRGRLSLSLYDGATGEFIGSTVTYIDGFVFTAYVDGAAPNEVQAKYSIQRQ